LSPFLAILRQISAQKNLGSAQKRLDPKSTVTLITDWLLSTSTKHYSALIGSSRRILRQGSSLKSTDQQDLFGVAISGKEKKRRKNSYTHNRTTDNSRDLQL
jgi:hypothetical protein